MSVLLDANVVSELIRKSPDPAVGAWIGNNPLQIQFFLQSANQSRDMVAAVLVQADAGKRW